MTSMQKQDKFSDVEDRPVGKPRGGRLARRARSFKEDFLEKLSQMRSPGGSAAAALNASRGAGGSIESSTANLAVSPALNHSGGSSNNISVRSVSPGPPGTGSIGSSTTQLDKNPLRDLHVHVRQVQLALLHFRDVVSKNKLEMLPGNGTVVLDTVSTIHTVLKSYLLYENSSTLGSATNQVYQALAQLLKLCDDVLLYGDQSSALDTANVTHVISIVEEAVQNLVTLAQEKISNKQKAAGSNRTSGYSSELTGHRNSLPDIPLTPRERQILEQTAPSSNALIRSSQSSESILRDSSPPPPKPSLPDRIICTSEDTSLRISPPPLPPKRKPRAVSQHTSQSQICDETDYLMATSLDGVSLQSRSPEDSSSLLSASAGSLDSALNHSRGDDEIRGIVCRRNEDEMIGGSMDLSLMASMQGLQMNGTGRSCGYGNWDGSEASLPNSAQISQQPAPDSFDHFTDAKMERLSTQTQESGFVSIHSQRSSTQSYNATNLISKRSSQQSSVSYNSATSYFQHHRLSGTDNNGVSSAILSQKTSKSSSHSSNLSSDPSNATFMEKLDVESLGSSITDGEPPALPEKRFRRRQDQLYPSQYDNMLENEHLSTCTMHTSNGSSPIDTSRPPPLPLKKKHIMAYMEMFGNCSHSNNDFISGLGDQHAVTAYAEWQQHQHHHHDLGMTTTTTTAHSTCTYVSQTLPGFRDQSSHSLSVSPAREMFINDSSPPPALPPKRSRSIKQNATPPPVSPKPTSSLHNVNVPDPLIITSTPIKAKSINAMPSEIDKKEAIVNDLSVGSNNISVETLSGPASKAPSNVSIDEGVLDLRDVDQDDSLLDELDINKYLVFKKQEEDGPEIRGGHPDALLIYAAKANKHDEKESDFLYQEAFLTTYRTFMTPLELIKKLQRRHQRFACSPDVIKQRAAREAFSLLVRVVSDLTASDLTDELLQTLMEFVHQLVCSGDLTMAKALRVKILEKHSAKQLQAVQPILSSLSVTTKQASLLDFKSEQIAEQMTLLDAELFMKIEIPEVLIWAQEQNEERSPNLTRFTEHFNKMSYWARSRILEHRMENEAKDREKYVVKFIKIMKHLRKINNFNSYLALLSALDSAPIRRLEWQKHITEGLKEYCALIDSSSSFRAYRQALAETQPPCIPYIGLVLQDLTFVHIGNSDLLADGSINFSKRWQQFNIVENMKRFKKGTYNFKKNERIITFFNNFSDFLCEEAMWQISESIKPRGGKKTQT